MIGALIVGGVLFAGVAIYTSNQTNDANRQSVRDTNAANRQAVESTNRTNVRLQREMNEYNSPQNQRKMYEEAGFNPYLVADNAGFNSTQTSIPTQTAPQMIPFQQDHKISDMFVNLGMQMYQSYLGLGEYDKLKAETKGIDLSNSFHEAFYGKQLEHQDLINKQLGLTNYGLELQNRFNDESFNDRLQEIKLNIFGKQVDNAFGVWNNLRAAKEFSQMDQRFQAEMCALSADIVYKGILSKKTLEEVNLLVQQTLKAQAETYGIEISNYVASNTANSLITAICSENDYKIAVNKFGLKRTEFDDMKFDLFKYTQLDIDSFDLGKELNKRLYNTGKDAKDVLNKIINNPNTSDFSRGTAQFEVSMLHLLDYIGDKLPFNSFNSLGKSGKAGSSKKSSSKSNPSLR